jgi:hypothetical protein
VTSLLFLTWILFENIYIKMASESLVGLPCSSEEEDA